MKHLLRTVVITDARGTKVRVGVDMFREAIGVDNPRTAEIALTKEVLFVLYGEIADDLRKIKTTDARTREALEAIINKLEGN